MASEYLLRTEEAIDLLEKAIKTKPKDTKVRIDLHKKANAKLKDLQKYMSDKVVKIATDLDLTTRTLEEAFGVASSNAGLRDREIVRHLRQAIKLSKEIDRPKKDWIAEFDKASKSVASWDPKADGVKELEQGIKSLEAGKKTIQANTAISNKEQRECNKLVDAAILELDDLKDPDLAKLLSPYLCKYAEFFK